MSDSGPTSPERSPKRRRVSSSQSSSSPSPPAAEPPQTPTTNGAVKPLPTRLCGGHVAHPNSLHFDDSPPTREASSPHLADDSHLSVPSPDGRPTPSPITASEAPESDDEYRRAIHAESPTPKQRRRVNYVHRLTLKGHKRGVAAVKFSPDGRWIASCSADASIRIWDAQSGAMVHTLWGHLAGISTIAWSPDSVTLASGSDDKSIRLWNAVAGKAYPEPLLGHHNYVYCVAFSPKGNMLVSGSYDEAVFLWDVRTGRLMRSLPAHSDPVGGVDFVRDGTLIVSCSSDGLIRVWDTATGQCLRTFFYEDTPPVVSVKFAPNGRYILAWMLDSAVRLWNYNEGRCVKTYHGHLNKKYSLVGGFGTYGDEDGEEQKSFVISGSEDGGIILWDVVSKEVLQRLKGHDAVVLGVDAHPKEKWLVSCGLDSTIRLWKDDQGDESNGDMNLDAD